MDTTSYEESDSGSEDDSEDDGYTGGHRGFQTNIDDFLQRFGSTNRPGSVNILSKEDTESRRKLMTSSTLQEKLLLRKSDVSIKQESRNTSLEW